MKALIPILVAASTLAGPALSAPRKVTILFTGDNNGEIAPCG